MKISEPSSKPTPLSVFHRTVAGSEDAPSANFSESCCVKETGTRVFIILFFLEEEVELCVYMSVRKLGGGVSKVGSATFFSCSFIKAPPSTNRPRIPVSVTFIYVYTTL